MNKLKSIKPSMWVNIFLWILTAIILIVFITIAAVLDIGAGFADLNNILVAALALAFAIMLMVSIVHIVIIKYQEKRKGELCK